MLLKELFSPIGAPKEKEQDINWVEDLKYFIDNDSEMLSQSLFPAIKKHKQMGDHHDAYKLYIKPIMSCKEVYTNKFNVEEIESKISKGDIIGLAKTFAEEQNKHIKNGDYED